MIVRSATAETSTAISAADCPAPTTRTRRPANGCGVRYACEWDTVPSKLPGWLGTLGHQKRPLAMTTARYLRLAPSPSVIHHVPPGAGPSRSTVLPKRINSRSPNASAYAPRYAAIALRCGKSPYASGIGKLGYCMRVRETFVLSDSYAPESPLSFS